MLIKMAYLKICFLLILIPLLLLSNQSQAQTMVISKIDSIKYQLKKTVKESEIIKISFAVVEEFMDIDQYDSAQIWLNKIAEIIPVRQASVSSYLLSSRQAEIYYYNRLLQLGLQETKRALHIAKTLNDSLLLSDAYNFTGLFYLNVDSATLAIKNFRQGIIYTRQPPYAEIDAELSKPHHLYGNLAEAYEKLNKYDSAIYFAKRSLQFAGEIKSLRGTSVALFNIGSNYSKLNITDSALHYFNLSIKASTLGKDFDIELLNYGRIAKTYQLKKNKKEALNNLDTGFNLIAKYPAVNKFYTNLFLEDAISVYKTYNLQPDLIAVLQQKSNLFENQIKSNTKQMSIILDASLQNETRVLNMEVEQAKEQTQKSKMRLYYLAALLALGSIAFVFYRYALIQKLQKSNLRNKISKDLHDDVGSSLSSLNLYSTVAAKVFDSNPGKAKEMLQKISDQSLIVMENISDIVWSMKPASNETVNLSTKIKILAADILSAAEINYKINIDPGADELVKGITARRTILMIIKEAINNAVKYSKANNLRISINKINHALMVEVTDDGKGFDTGTKNLSSNGLINMQKRALELNGSVVIKSGIGTGTTVTALLPLAALNNVGW